MSGAFIGLTVLLVISQLALPRKVGFLPLLVAACHLGNVEILGDFTTVRLLIAIGLIRAMAGGYFYFNWKAPLDRTTIVFSAWAMLSAMGHHSQLINPWVERAGLILNVVGTYLYGRAYLPNLDAFRRFAFLLPLVLLPLAAAMTLEQRSQRNLYFGLGAASPESPVRDGKVRATGPFRSPILAGCAGATSLSFALLLWRTRRKFWGALGFAACMGVTLACASSGPLAAVAVTGLSVVLWRWRRSLNVFIWTVVALALLYNLVKGRGPWYLMASIDLVGGSTGWHRAHLIDQGLTYFADWWLVGTDYTRHWMATGVSWSPDHVDLTNYYLHLGVTGGAVLPICIIAMLVICFKLLGRGMKPLRDAGDRDEIVLWCAGAALATHAVSFISISYFDQMYVLFYLLVSAVPGMVATVAAQKQTTTLPKEVLAPEYGSPTSFST